MSTEIQNKIDHYEKSIQELIELNNPEETTEIIYSLNMILEDLKNKLKYD